MRHIQEMVEVAMLTDPVTRDDDFILYSVVANKVNPLTSSIDLGTLFRNHERYGLPSYESVVRARRKIQESNPSLRPSPQTTNARYKKWKEVREWALH